MDNSKQYDLLIVGAGLTGAMYAWRYRQEHKSARILVIDRNSYVGGLCHTYDEHGICVQEFGAHIFHTDKKEVWDFVNGICEFRPFVNSPVANYNGELYNLPFNMNTFHQLWGVRTPEEARIELQKRKVDYGREPQNMEEAVLSQLGEEIYLKFFKDYTEKQWGMPCSKLPASIARRLPVRYTYDNNYFRDTYSGIPRKGYTFFIEQLLAGCEVRLGVDYHSDRESYDALAEKVVYTGPIDAFFGFRHGRLGYRSVRFDHVWHGEIDNYQGVAVMNFTDKTPYTRVIEHKHFLKQECSGTVVSHEYPVPFTESTIPAYPILVAENEAILDKYKAEAARLPNIEFAGRLAEYRYYDMDDIVEKYLI